MITRNRGFGLVEIMVGLFIGLLSMIVIMQVYGAFEGQKRDTTSGGDAQTNGALALYLMEREVRAAGNGMTEGEPQKYPPLAGCSTLVYDTAAYLTPQKASISAATPSTLVSGGASSIRFAPVLATSGVGNLSDSLTVIYGSSAITAPYTLAGAFNPSDTSISLVSGAGINQGDMVVLVQEASKVNGNYITPKVCSLMQATGPAVGGVLPVNGGRYNGATGKAVMTDEARLYNLGQVNIVTYRIFGNNLVADTTKFGVTPDGSPTGVAITNRTDFSPLASNIVNMQVQYGIDTGNPGTNLASCKINPPGVALTTGDADAVVDSWVDPTGTWGNDGTNSPSLFDLRRIRAVRIGLVARTGVQSRGTPDDPCVSGPVPGPGPVPVPVKIHWDNGPDMTPDLSADPNWACYRYKVFQTTIPIRNMIWSSTMNPASSASCGLRDL